MTRLVRGIARLARDRAGAAAAEFALLIPVLMTMLFGTIEYGLVMFSYSSMQTAAASVARMVSVNTVKTDAEAKVAAAAMLPKWFSSNAVVTVTQSSAGNPLLNRITVQIAIPITSATPLAVFTRVSPWTLTTQVAIDQEVPYA